MPIFRGFKPGGEERGEVGRIPLCIQLGPWLQKREEEASFLSEEPWPGDTVYEKVLSDATFLFSHQDKKDLITRKRERKRFKGRDFQCGEFACVWALVG